MEKIFNNIDEMYISSVKYIEVQSAASVDFLPQMAIGGFKGIRNKFNSTSKWLKVVHGIQKKPLTIAWRYDQII